MPVNLGFATASNDFLIAALLIYSLAVLAFAGDYAFGRPRRKAEATAAAPAAQLATVGGGSAVAGGPPATAAGPAAPVLPASRAGAFRAVREAGPWVRAAVSLSVLGALVHLAAVVCRGLAVRYRAWALGVFVMGAVVLALGLAETLIYTAAGPLVPALQSYWLSIHVTAMTLATGIFFVAAVLGIMYLVAERYRKRVEAGKAEPGNGLIARIPSAAQLDKLTYRTVVFGFPIWTFGVIAGAIWADQAWGRYWGWDPVETWAFITWVIYAAYLHARATAGWRGARAHYIQLLGFASLVTNMLIVQVFITGMHSYAGVSG
jgi:cytochrome c-type biogenesis protein CcsB